MSSDTQSSSSSSSTPMSSPPQTPPNLHQNSIDPESKWLVQKFGGTSVGKYPVKIAKDVVSNYIDSNKVAIVCSACSGSTKALGTTNMLLRAASEAIKRRPKNHRTPGTGAATPAGFGLFGQIREIPYSPTSPSTPSRSRSSSGPEHNVLDALTPLTVPSCGQIQPEFNVTVDLIRSEHYKAAKEAITNDDIRKELEEEIDRDCDWLRSFLFASQVIDEISPRSKDSIVGLGERLACKFMTAVFRDQGIDAEYVSLEDIVPQVEDESEGTLDQSFYDRVAEAVGKRVKQCGRRVPVVTGFFGPVPGSLLTQVGRGYTDLLSALLAVGLEASELQIWKEVDGIFTADPRKVPTARVLPIISPDEAAELTYYGSEVVHPFTMEQVIRRKIPIRIKNVENPPGEGTVIYPDPEVVDASHEAGVVPNGIPEPIPRSKLHEMALAALHAQNDFRKLPTAVTIKEHIIVININSNRKSVSHGFFAGIFGTLDRFGVVVDLISTSEVHVSMAIEDALAPKILDRLVRELKKNGTVTVHNNMAILSLVGKQMRHLVGVAGRMFTTLGQGNVNIEMISQGASEINISVVCRYRREGEWAHGYFDAVDSLVPDRLDKSSKVPSLMSSDRLMKEDIGSMITVLGVVIAAVHIAIQSDKHSTRLQRALTIQRECEEFLGALKMGDFELVQEMEDGFLDKTKDNLEARYLEDPEIRASAMSTEYRDWLKISIELKTLLHYLQRFRQSLSEASIHTSSSPSSLGIPPYPPRHTLVSSPSYTLMPNGSSDPRTVPPGSHTKSNLVRRASNDFTSMPLPNPSSPHTNPIYHNSGHQSDASHYAPGYSPPLPRQLDPNLPSPSSASPHLHRRQSINLPQSTTSPIYAQQNTSRQSVNTNSQNFPQSSAPAQHHAGRHSISMPPGPPMYAHSDSSHQSVNFPSQNYPQSPAPIPYNTGHQSISFPQPQFTPASIYAHPNSSRQSVNGPLQNYPQSSPSIQRHASRHSISIPPSTTSGPIFAHSNSSRQSVNISPPNVPQSATVDPVRPSLYAPDASMNDSSSSHQYQFNGEQSIYRPPHSGSLLSFTPSDKSATPAKGILKKSGRRYSEGATGLESTHQASKSGFAPHLFRSWSTTATVGGSASGDSSRKNSNGEERGRRSRPPPVGSDRYGLERFSPTDIFIPDFEIGATASALSHLSLDPGSRYPDFTVPQEVRRRRSSSSVRDSAILHPNAHKREGSEHKSSSKLEKKHDKKHEKKHEKGDSKRKDKDHKR
uniref:aspartate kinase n=1 Tax=Moniliophthora roreri TaxID=221103 RepID=A0A0W0FF11_MONRR